MTSYEELLSLFISNPDEAISKSQELICDVTIFNTYSEFYSFHLDHPHFSTCQREWSKPQMAIQCFDCSNVATSCVCLQCFLKGDHKDHDYIIIPDSRGNCDCGDLSNWKRPGFCCEHQGVEENSNPENYLETNLRNVLTDCIFKAAFMALISLNNDENAKYEHIIQFISSFLRFGDGFRRLIVITITEKVGANIIFNSIFDGSEQFNKQLEKLCVSLVNDDVFRCSISTVVYDLIINRIMPEKFEFKTKKTNYSPWNLFWFHLFLKKPLENSIKNGWDWVSFTLKLSTLMKKYFTFIGNAPPNCKPPECISDILVNIPKTRHLQTSEQTQLFFDELFTNVLNTGSSENLKDNIVVASFSDSYEKNYYTTVFFYKYTFFDLINCFKHKKNLKLDKLFEELDKLTDISPIYCHSTDKENDKFVSKFFECSDDKFIDVNNNYFKSFHNGGSFFYCFPLYESLLHILRTDNMNRVKVARFFSMGKYQSLRVKLGIVALKDILSFVCLHQSLTSKRNHGLQNVMNILLKPCSLCDSFPLYLPLFQLLLGIQCNDKNVTDEFSMKEFFAFEMAREIGLFDNYESDDYSDEEIDPLKKQMFFSVLYMAILIVIERSLFNFSSYNIIEEQIVLALKSGISQLSQLNESFSKDIDVRYKQIFNEIISKVATTNRNSEKNNNNDTKESSFFLKKDVKWKTITALNQFNTQKIILEKEITKNPNNLLQIPDFEPEENFFYQQKSCKDNKSEDTIDEYDIDSTGLSIKLKEFLFTPTILAVVYHTLRSTSEDRIQKVTLNDHLAMMILVLVYRFANEIEAKNPPFNDSTVVQYDSSLNDLISKLKKTVFCFNIDPKDGVATIKNTLDSKSFYTFLNVKIESPEHPPKSLIDLLIEKGEIGKNVLNQMQVDISKYGFDDISTDKKQAQINKMRAKKLKEEIMNQFKSTASNYNFSDIGQLDESIALSEKNSDACAICSTTKKNEILSFSIYIYRTKIPFAFDKPPNVIYNPQFEVPVDDDINDLIFNDYEKLHLAYEDEDCDEENEEPNINQMIKNMPNLENQEDKMLNFLLIKFVIDSYVEKLKIYEEKKIKKQFKQKMQAYKEEVLKSEAYNRGISNTERMVTVGNNFIIQFSICPHPVHPECVKESVFNCPIDRSKRNGFLPFLDGIQKEKIFKDYDFCHEVSEVTLTDEMQASLKNFMNIYSSFIKDSDIFVELIKSISGLISTYEVRLRSLPDCLDSEKTKLLSRNLFLTTWYLYRMCGKPKIGLHLNPLCNIEARLTTFQKFIKCLIECDDLVNPENNSKYTKQMKDAFMKIVSSFISSQNFSISSDILRSEKMIYLFLKRVCLTDHFLLSNENISNESKHSNLHDWDEILSVSNLSEYFCIKLDSLTNLNGSEFEFSPIVFSRMPKDFLHFALKPYNFNVEETKKIIMFNIIDYNYLIKHHDDFSDVIVDEDEEMKKNQRNVIMLKQKMSHIKTILTTEYSRYVYPSVFLSIGQFSSKVYIVNEQEMSNLKPFYLDRFGCEDIDYKRGMPLFFNEERYDRMIDEILSGDFSFYFRS